MGGGGGLGDGGNMEGDGRKGGGGLVGGGNVGRRGDGDGGGSGEGNGDGEGLGLGMFGAAKFHTGESHIHMISSLAVQGSASLLPGPLITVT